MVPPQVASENVCSRHVLSARGLPYSIGSAHSTSALSLCWVLLLYPCRIAHTAPGDATSGQMLQGHTCLLLQELGLQDIARIDGWVKTDQLEPQLSLLNPTSDSPIAEDTSEPVTASSESPLTPGKGSDSALSDESASHELEQEVEHLSDDMYTYSAAPTASSAVPTLNAEYSMAGEFTTHDMLGQLTDSETELALADSESAETAPEAWDPEEEEEGSLLERSYAAHPDELCRYAMFRFQVKLDSRIVHTPALHSHCCTHRIKPATTLCTL